MLSNLDASSQGTHLLQPVAAYVGHETEMPSWGLYGLKYRDVDAMADYIERGLRGRG